MATPLQSTSARRQRHRRFLQREPAPEVLSRPALETQDKGIRLRQLIQDDAGRFLRNVESLEQVKAELATLPLVAADLMIYELIAVTPLRLLIQGK